MTEAQNSDNSPDPNTEKEQTVELLKNGAEVQEFV